MGDTSLPTADLVKRTRWYVAIRWSILLLLAIPGLLSLYLPSHNTASILPDIIFTIVALFTNLIFFVLTRIHLPRHGVQTVATLLLVVDITLITFFIDSKGGIESRSVILYVLPMIMSAAIFGRVGVYLTTIGTIAAYVALIIAAYAGLVTVQGTTTPLLDHQASYLINTLVFFSVLLFVVCLAIDFMTRLLIAKEAEAREHLADLRHAQAIAKFGSWEWDEKTNMVTCSDEMVKIWDGNLGSSVVTFEQLQSAVHPDDQKLVTRVIATARKKPKTFSFQTRINATDGTVRYLQAYGESIANRAGRVTKIIGTVRDMTEDKLLQKAKNDFVALASHQLRTPATIVKQYVAMLRDGYIGRITPEQREYLDTAYDNNERQIKIVNDLLNIARIDSNSFKIMRVKTDLVALMQTIIRDQTAKFAAKSQKLSFNCHLKTLPAQVDRDQLRMAIDNILDNAHKYTPTNKTIKLRLSRAAHAIVIDVVDQGVGIAKEDLPKMFKMFSRIENPHILAEEGTGLGLYWAQKIVSMHGGKINVSSRVNQGTTFSIRLPLSS